MARSDGGGGGGGGGVLAALSVVVLGGLQRWHRAEMLRRAQLEEGGGTAAAGAEASGLWTAAALLAGLAVVLFGAWALYRALRVPSELWKDPDHPRDWLGFPVVAEEPAAAPPAPAAPPPEDPAPEPPAPSSPALGWPRALLSWVLGAGALLMLVATLGLGYRHALSSPTPVAVDLAALEGGAPLPDPHVAVGKHLALEHWAALRIPEGAPDGPAAPVTGAWVPLVSGRHPFVQGLRAERLGREDLLTVPRTRRSELGPVAFLSEARTLATRGDRPARARLRDQVRGVAYRRASRLAREDRALLRETFPGIDLERAWILREGRAPPGLDDVLVCLAVALALGYLTRRARQVA